jgi:hypothetical protein
MKKLLLILLCLPMMLLTSCSKSNIMQENDSTVNPNLNERFFGAWENSENDYIFTFNSDATFEWNYSLNTSYTGNWYADDNNLFFSGLDDWLQHIILTEDNTSSMFNDTTIFSPETVVQNTDPNFEGELIGFWNITWVKQ